MIKESFDELVRNKAKNQTALALAKHAEAFGITSTDALKAFKIGSWDAMIFDMAYGLNLTISSSHAHRKELINKWLAEGL